MNVNILQEIVEELLRQADTLSEKESLDPMEQGELLAYAEALCIMQDAMAGYDLSEVGLDFDVDKKYLYRPNEPEICQKPGTRPALGDVYPGRPKT